MTRFIRMASKSRALTVLVDMDGVLADFEGQFLENFREKYPDEKFVELNDRRTFYIDDDKYEDSDKVNSIIQGKGFYSSLPPIDGACQALKEMSSMSNVLVYICSSPLVTKYENCASEKGEWIARYLGRDWLRRFILTVDKTMVRGDILIDDKHKITGTQVPTWDHVVFTACHNRHIDLKGRHRLESWKPADWTALIDHYKKKCLS